MSLVAPAAQEPDADPRLPRRVRHEAKRRLLEVRRVERIAAHMVRVTLGGDELHGFTSLGFDDHIKLFFPDAGMVPNADGELKPPSRDYTPRHYDAAANTLAIDFVLHDAGPATRWAEQVKSGQTLAIGGPRGSLVIPFDYDWHLLIGDDTALPAIGRRLAELPHGSKAVVLAEVDDEADQIAFASAAYVSVAWVHRKGAEPGSTDLLSKGLKTLKLPSGDFYAWVACESLTAKALRAQLIADHGANPKWMRAAGYWRRGAVAIHDTHND